MDHSRLSMPLGEAMFTQRSIRRLRPDPIPIDDIRLIVEYEESVTRSHR